MVVVPGRGAERGSLNPLLPTEEGVDGPSVLVIDQQPLFLAALGSLLTAPPVRARMHFAQVSDVGFAIAAKGGVDLVFCEVRAEPIPVLELASRLSALTPKVPMIVLGDSDDDRMITAALDSSVAGLFTKNAALDEFLVGVRVVLAGHRAIGAVLMGRLLARLSDQASSVRHHPGQLSATELDILSMIGQAKSIQDIAAIRGISQKTVRNHLANIYRKLDLRTRTEAMLWAARMGLTSN